MQFSLKTKITTPRIEETVDFYKQIFGMVVVEEWNSPEDRGTILAFEPEASGPLLEVYYGEEEFDFTGLSLQFKVEGLAEFVENLPEGIGYEGPKPRPWGATYLYLRDPNDVLVIVYEGCV